MLARTNGGDSSAVYSRLELLKNCGGRGKGSQVLFERAFHRFIGLSVSGQDAAEGRAAYTDGEPRKPRRKGGNA